MHLLAFRLDHSICNFCGWIRNPKEFEKFKTDWHCKGCNIPGMILTQSTRIAYRKIGKYCNLCYMQDWYEWHNGRRFKREEAIKREIVTT